MIVIIAIINSSRHCLGGEVDFYLAHGDLFGLRSEWSRMAQSGNMVSLSVELVCCFLSIYFYGIHMGTVLKGQFYYITYICFSVHINIIDCIQFNSTFI